MRILIGVGAVLLAAAFLVPAPAHAASFDCARATRADEIAICRSPRLSELDAEMGGLWYAYSRVPMLMGGNGARLDMAREFLTRRAACGRNIACLTGVYRARIQDLRGGIDGAMTEFRRLQNGD